ncbi:excinuclease ABC subunit A [Candidatus Liberibacter solanacearum]|uniref:UvrABC system protein A n=1 Tax=Candidatus Liberibacter solanacearum TaxID=556287 RepID=A0A094Z3R0_9HYPH|nr:excinuclease ABC subunit UvrA [Candidatus Liberibacter solanacearum]KGB27579.1 excinuclease ABC subunit A [Candidatus Liberibacter solanacearum]KJZ80716.1 excinuclease ABC subunit A [Candidatus Liberibacter solanacearum]KJZ81807.1 Excinuclease ABC subunit A [Candidatus Liberibacter solanacearum]KQC48863.1 ABC-ATPase UvrA [Candidatus Liberibacter solanacearum]
MCKIKNISIHGAREHNLQNISIELPRNKLIIITGVSGSGKSSLAFDTIHAEGQRRYIESLSTYARQFLGTIKKPDVDRIDGLSPTISIEQKNTSHNPRSTVGTITEIHDYLRLLFARIGIPHSPTTGLPIEKQTVSQMADRILTFEQGTRMYMLAPIVRNRKGEYKKELAALLKQGFQRIKIDGEFYQISDAPNLDKKYKHNIEVVVDRIVIHENIRDRIVNSLKTCLQLANGLCIAEIIDSSQSCDKKTPDDMKHSTPQNILFSEKLACPVSGFSIAEIEPRIFSFNNPAGACHHCDGLGISQKIDENLIIPNPKLALHNGAIAPWSTPLSEYHTKILTTLGEELGFSLSDRWCNISEEIQKMLLYGTKKNDTIPSLNKKSSHTNFYFKGIIPTLEQRWNKEDSAFFQEIIQRYMSSSPCPVCNGYRLKSEAFAIKINGKHIGEITDMSIKKVQIWFEKLPAQISQTANKIAESILEEIQKRIRFLVEIGLDYLTLSRNSNMLSNGESQRIRLASQIGSGLTGVLYVLDEPSIGLHQRDNAKLINTLKHLRDTGNTVIVVEHDEETMLAADHIVDIGPDAGVNGGKIVAEGSPAQIIAHPTSLTGKYMSGEMKIKIPQKRRQHNPNKMIHVINARSNNLKNITASIPIGLFTAITGISGGGKSTFLISTLYKAAARLIMGAKYNPGIYDRIDGLEYIDKVININQSPIGHTPRSNPATYVGAFTPIRDWFSNLPESKALGYNAGCFSFNVKGGRCEVCEGNGVIKIAMHFLPDVYITCDICQGKRYNPETLNICFKGKSMADILAMTVEESADFFTTIPAIHNKLKTLKEVGLGYIKIGQSANTLSGGESQRVKLAKELSKKATGNTLYILDEPTTGLHYHDIAKLLDILHTLVERGNSIIVIEHNLEVIKTADWILDFGPEGGDNGGKIIASGTPEDIAKEASSYTGKFLKSILKEK